MSDIVVKPNELGTPKVTIKVNVTGGTDGGGLPTGGTAFQQLVTDADGNAVWEDRTHYAMPHSGVIMPETTIEAVDPDSGMCPIMSPIGLVDGRDYIVTLNGTEYECRASRDTLDGSIHGVFIGNPAAIGGTVNEMPFALMELDEDIAAEQGVAGVCLLLDGSASAQIKIEATGEIVKTIDEKYIPDLGIPNVLVVHAWPADGSGNMIDGCEVKFSMPIEEVRKAEENGAIVLMRVKLTTSNRDGVIFTRSSASEFKNIEVTCYNSSAYEKHIGSIRCHRISLGTSRYELFDSSIS